MPTVAPILIHSKINLKFSTTHRQIINFSALNSNRNSSNNNSSNLNSNNPNSTPNPNRFPLPSHPHHPLLPTVSLPFSNPNPNSNHSLSPFRIPSRRPTETEITSFHLPPLRLLHPPSRNLSSSTWHRRVRLKAEKKDVADR